jgi:predicted nucleic acid-binding protein
MMQVMRAAEIVATCRIAYVEIRAALAAAARAARITLLARDQLVQDLEQLWESMLRISANESTIRQAGDLAERMELRGYDAVHLAALSLAGSPSDVSLACWDNNLRRAGRALGYHLIPS